MYDQSPSKEITSFFSLFSGFVCLFIVVVVWFSGGWRGLGEDQVVSAKKNNKKIGILEQDASSD